MAAGQCGIESLFCGAVEVCSTKEDDILDLDTQYLFILVFLHCGQLTDVDYHQTSLLICYKIDYAKEIQPDTSYINKAWQTD